MTPTEVSARIARINSMVEDDSPVAAAAMAAEWCLRARWWAKHGGVSEEEERAFARAAENLDRALSMLELPPKPPRPAAEQDVLEWISGRTGWVTARMAARSLRVYHGDGGTARAEVDLRRMAAEGKIGQDPGNQCRPRWRSFGATSASAASGIRPST